MRKLVCIFLTISLICMFSITAYGEVSTQKNVRENVIDIEGGKLFSYEDIEKNVTILANEQGNEVHISIKYSEEPNTVYQWIFDEYAVTFNVYDKTFWYDIIRYAENKINEATVIVFTETIYDSLIPVNQSRGSAAADLQEQLENLSGETEYFGDDIYTVTYQGKTCTVYESLDFQIYKEGRYAWSDPITVTSFITGVLGYVAGQTLVGTVCNIFGLAVSAYSLLPENGTVEKYLCRELYYRDVKIHGSNYIYNTTYKFVDYYGYDNTTMGNTQRAKIDVGSCETSYSDSYSYFLSCIMQVQDACALFDRIGYV